MCVFCSFVASRTCKVMALSLSPELRTVSSTSLRCRLASEPLKQFVTSLFSSAPVTRSVGTLPTDSAVTLKDSDGAAPREESAKTTTTSPSQLPVGRDVITVGGTPMTLYLV